MHVGVLMCMRARMRVYVGNITCVFAVPAPKCQDCLARKSPEGKKKKGNERNERGTMYGNY